MAAFKFYVENGGFELSKGQLSLFILLGVVVIILVAILYLVSDRPNTSSVSGDQLQPVKDLVQGCMQKVVQDGTVTLLRQGGFLFESQGGPEPDPSALNEGILFVNYQNHKVFIPITPLTNFPAGTPYTGSSPMYPAQYFPFMDALHTPPAVTSGPFGMLNLRPLDAGQGSWEYQLEQYVNNNLLACINPASLPLTFPGMAFDSGVPSSTVTIASEKLTLDVIYHVKVTSQGKETSIEQFTENINIPLGKLYTVVVDRLTEEVQNFAYNIDDPLHDGNGFKINVYYGVSGGADVIEFEDSNDFIAGQKVVFWVARLNRVPALGHIKPVTLSPGVAAVTAADINPVGYDLDEDLLSFSYVPSLPYALTSSSLTLRVTVSDGQYEDYQDVLVVSS